MNFALLVIQWMLLLILAIAYLFCKRRLEIVRHNYREALKELEAGRKISADLCKRCGELENQRDYYHGACTASEKKRQELVSRLNSLKKGENDNAVSES